MIDLCFEVESDDDFDDIDIHTLLEAAEQRVNYLKAHPQEAREAMGIADCYEPEIKTHPQTEQAVAQNPSQSESGSAGLATASRRLALPQHAH